MNDLIYEIFNDLPRLGPGDAKHTLRAFNSIKFLTADYIVMDVGCGNGAQTADLAPHIKGRVLAIDNHLPYLEQLKNRVCETDFRSKIQPIAASMFELPFKPGSIDVIWAEGSIYFIGSEKGLREFKGLLKKNGYICFTELEWAVDDPPIEVLEFFRSEYPDMSTHDKNKEVIVNAGYDLIDSFPLPPEAWWGNYYQPLEQRLPMLREKYKDNHEALDLIGATEKEIDIFKNYNDSYCYRFYIVQNN